MDYKKLTLPYKDEMLDNLSKFVSINSAYNESSKDKQNPFGKGVTDALNFIASLASKDGFNVINYDNMVVEISIGEGDKNITIMAHADVVPAGTGWDQDPFEMTNRNGVLMGRGVADDKGPLLSSYYALKALKDNNLLGNYKVRFLVGGNEESGSLCMEHYFKTLKMPQPTYGFSPDSNYPLIYGEKGMVNFEVKTKINVPQIISLQAGVAFNSVIERADAILEKQDGLREYFEKITDKHEIVDLGDLLKVSFYGTAAHGSIPWEGENAGINLLNALANFYKDENLLKAVNCLADSRGRGLNAYFENKEMGTCSLNVGLINIVDGELSIVCNYRFINETNKNEASELIKNALAPLNMNIMSTCDLLYFPVESTLVSTLLECYQQETGDLVTPPLTTGGGTYAKEADNVVAFGTEYPGWDAHMHSPGECIKVDHLVESMAIYAHAIIALGNKL